MMPAIDYKQRLLEEMEGLSDRDWEKLYKVLTLIREEFLEVDDEARYYTASWIAAEREATAATASGGQERRDARRGEAREVPGAVGGPRCPTDR